MGANGSSEVADFRAKYGSSVYTQGMYEPDCSLQFHFINPQVKGEKVDIVITRV